MKKIFEVVAAVVALSAGFGHPVVNALPDAWTTGGHDSLLLALGLFFGAPYASGVLSGAASVVKKTTNSLVNGQA